MELEITKRKHLSSSSSTSSSPIIQPGKKQRNVSEEGDEVVEALDLAATLGDKMNVIMLKLDKLDKLDNIETNIQSLQEKMCTVEKSVKILEGKFATVETNQDNLQRNFDELQEAVSFLNGSVDQFKDQSELNKNSLQKEIKNLERKLSYLEAYGRRENLKFHGIKEEVVGSTENTREVWNKFLKTHMKVENPESLEIQRIHRLYFNKRDDNTPRPIIVRFLRFSDREKIWKKGSTLKGTNYKMYEDFPRSIQEARKAQLPALKQARKNNKRANFSATFPDKLYIEGKCVNDYYT